MGIFRNIWGRLHLLKAVLQGGYFELSFIPCHYCADYSCVQRNRRLIIVVFSTMECENYFEFIIYPICPTRNYAHPCFLKTARFWKLFCETVRKEEAAVKQWETLWNWVTKVKLWELRCLVFGNSLYLLMEKNSCL